MSRAAPGVIIAVLALGFGLFGTGAAQASTTAAGRAETAAAVTIRSADTAVPEYQSVTAAPGYCNEGFNCTLTTGLMYYGEGSCEANITVHFYPATNRMTISVGMYSPYLFAGCTAWATVTFTDDAPYGDRAPTYTSGSYYGYSCALLDFTCSGPSADGGTWTYTNVATGIPAGLDPTNVDEIQVTVTE
jgi:hypothetical protein